jgi:serine/threonine protein kinase
LENIDEGRLLENSRYRLTHILGRGGMATVYRAHDRRLDMFRAIKMLLPEYASNVNIRRRFEMEARTTAKLHHANIVTVHDVSIDGEKLFIVMELITGGCLMDRVRDIGTLPPRLAVRTIAQLLEGLHYAHECGVIHRDIKPHNIMITNNETPKLADFGIAHLTDSEAQMTRTGSVMGTWAYMAPEQRASARQVDARSDVYSCTATLFALLTGEEPFDLFAPDAHPKLFAEMPDALRTVISKGSAYLQDARYASAMDLKLALEEVLGGLPDDPEDTPPLASPDLVRRFVSGSLSGMASEPLYLSNPEGQSSPTFDSDSLPLDDRATASGRFADLDASIVREADQRREEGAGAPISPARGSGKVKLALLIIVFLGVGFVVTLFLAIATISLWQQDAGAVLGVVEASPTGGTPAAEKENAKPGADDIADTDAVGSIAPAGAAMDPSPATATAPPTTVSAEPKPVPTTTTTPDPVPIVQETVPPKEESSTPTGRLRLRCLPGCDIVIKSKVLTHAPAINAKDSFKGRVPLGKNVIRMTPANGKVVTHEVLVLSTGSPSYCWDFTTKSHCKKESLRSAP